MGLQSKQSCSWIRMPGRASRLVLAARLRHALRCVRNCRVCNGLLLLAWAGVVASGEERTNVALHAQSNYEMHGWVAGSEVTTSGLRRAFEALASVQHCEVFAPFSYNGLSSRKWDLVLIEGFAGSVPAFIHEVRAGNAEVVVLFYCLDTYPSLSVVGNLDVDAFLTNSRVLLPFMKKISPASSLVHLAVDPLVMVEQPFDPAYSHNVVYLGQFKATKHRLIEVLKEVAPFGLAVYGNGWDRSGAKELLPFWRGVLPLEDIASLYSSAKVVLSTTETLQRSLGMVNNRVFEALACGASVVSDAFPEMEDMFSDHVLYYRQPGDAARAVEKLLGNDAARVELGRRGRQLVSSKHTYASRVQSVLLTMEDVLNLRAQEPSGAGAKAVLAEAVPSQAPEARGGSADRPQQAAILEMVASSADTDLPGARAVLLQPEERGGFCSGAGPAVAVPARSNGSCGATPDGAAVTFLASEQREDGLQRVRFPASEGGLDGNIGDDERRPGQYLGSAGLLPSPRAEKTTPGSGTGRPLQATTALARSDGKTGVAPEVNNTGVCDQILDGACLTLVRPPSKQGSSEPFRGRTRSNAPMVLVVYRSDCPLPGRLRRDLESAVARAAGGARMRYVGVGEAVSDEEEGMEEEKEGASRLKMLEGRLSRLLTASDAENPNISGLNLLGGEAAAEARAFMEWCCSVGMIVVYAEVGDPLEKHFLHPLAEETVHRVVRTAFFAACPEGGDTRESGCSSMIQDRILESRADPQRIDRYEWVQRFRDAPYCEETVQPKSCPEFSKKAMAGRGEGSRCDGIGLEHKIEDVLFGTSRHAAVYIKEPQNGTLVAARRRLGEGAGGWAEVELVVEVEHPFFRTPDDGMWCVLLDGMEVGCRGDHDSQEAMVKERRHSLAIAVQVNPLALPRRANVQAVLMGGSLESVRVLRRSSLVSISLWPTWGAAE